MLRLCSTWILAAALAACSAESVRPQVEGDELAMLEAVPVPDAGREIPEPLKQLVNDGDNIVVCNPGCALQNDDAGKPIIPNWCEAWGPITPNCVRFGDKTYCIGMWEGAGRSVNEVTDDGTVFHLDASPKERRVRAPNNDVYFGCTRINREKFTSGSGKYDLQSDLPDAPETVSCSPGCIIDTEDMSRTFPNKPGWCLRARNVECSSNLAASCLEPRPLNLCYQLKPVGGE